MGQNLILNMNDKGFVVFRNRVLKSLANLACSGVRV